MGNADKYLSEDHFYQMFIKKDILMNPEKKGKPNMRPITSNPLYGLQALKTALEEIHAETYDNYGNPIEGQLPNARAELKLALEEWAGFAVRTGKDPDQPEGRWLEDINKCKARVEYLCAKSRKLNNLIDAAEKKETDRKAAKQAKKAKRHQLRGVCRKNNGAIVECDARPVLDGKFVDTGEDVQKYLANIKKEMRAEGKRQYQAEKKRIAGLVGVMPAL